MKTSIYILVMLSFFFITCDQPLIEKKAKFDILNMTGWRIDSLNVQIKGTEVKNWYQLENGQRTTLKIDMSEVTGDGSYTLYYRKEKDTTMRMENFGYFSNGTPDEERTVLKILPDKVDITVIERTTVVK